MYIYVCKIQWEALYYEDMARSNIKTTIRFYLIFSARIILLDSKQKGAKNKTQTRKSRPKRCQIQGEFEITENRVETIKQTNWYYFSFFFFFKFLRDKIYSLLHVQAVAILLKTFTICYLSEKYV